MPPRLCAPSLVDDTCGLYCGTGRRAQDHSAAAAVVSSCRARACVRLWSVVECVSVSLSASSICEAPETALHGFVWSRGHTTPARQLGRFESSWVLLPHSPSGGFALAVLAPICQHCCGELLGADSRTHMLCCLHVDQACFPQLLCFSRLLDCNACARAGFVTVVIWWKCDPSNPEHCVLRCVSCVFGL